MKLVLEGSWSLSLNTGCPPTAQENQEQLGSVVSSLKQLYGLRYIYCWHGLSAYWSGVSADPRERGVAKYKASLHYSEVQLSGSLLSLEAQMNSLCPQIAKTPMYSTFLTGFSAVYRPVLCCLVHSHLPYEVSKTKAQRCRGGHRMRSKGGEVAACCFQPTAGLVEIEPSMAWNPSVVSGIGVVQDVDELYNDMHSYLASSGMSCKSSADA